MSQSDGKKDSKHVHGVDCGHDQDHEQGQGQGQGQEHGAGHVHGPDCNHGHSAQTPFVRTNAKVGRNDPCICGSGAKFKKCCGKS